MRVISCARCKGPLGELATGSKIKTGTIHLCETCGKLIIAEAFKQESRPLDFMDLFKNRFNSKK